MVVTSTSVRGITGFLIHGSYMYICERYLTGYLLLGSYMNICERYNRIVNTW